MNTMEFQLKGKLVDFNLTEVIQFLSMNRKSGELAIHDSAHDKVGSLFLLEGELVHATMNGSIGTTAFDRILHLADGYFIFLAELRTESRSIKQSIQVLLMEAHTRNDERRQLQGQLPHADTILTLANEVACVPSLNTSEWKALSFVNGRRSIARICLKFGDELGALWALHGLYSKGLVVPVAAESPLFPLTPLVLHASVVSEERPYPPRLRTNLLLKAIDGRTTLKRLADGLKMDFLELNEDIRLLVELKWISFNAEDERIWNLYWQDPH
ncbi:MAG: DUF4388 domain-containing protein [Candidatus Aminicenantes bacterium]|nr:DUF4388 domain-containing protein [Candidatus Aminicenantes bacterium]